MSYCKPELLAQLTSGELSQDQAVPTFSYKDDSTYLNDMIQPKFFDPIGSQIEVGSTIQLTGRVNNFGLFINVANVVVQEKEYNPADAAPYEYKITVQIGSDKGLFWANNDSGAANNQQSIVNLQGSQCKFKGYCVVNIPAVPANDTVAVTLNTRPILNIDETDFAFGAVGGSNISLHPAGVDFVLVRTYCGPNPDQISYAIKSASSAAPNGTGYAYIYTEVHRPLSALQPLPPP